MRSQPCLPSVPTMGQAVTTTRPSSGYSNPSKVRDPSKGWIAGLFISISEKVKLLLIITGLGSRTASRTIRLATTSTSSSTRWDSSARPNLLTRTKFTWTTSGGSGWAWPSSGTSRGNWEIRVPGWWAPCSSNSNTGFIWILGSSNFGFLLFKEDNPVYKGFTTNCQIFSRGVVEELLKTGTKFQNLPLQESPVETLLPFAIGLFIFYLFLLKLR